MADEPALVEHDSRGILAHWLLRQRMTLTRYPATPALVGLVDRFWCVRWDLPDGAVHRQEVLTHLGANLVVSHPDADAPLAPRRGSRYAGLEAVVSGVATAVVTRTLAGSGWAVAAMTTPGGLGAFTRGPASRLTDTVVALEQVLDVDADALIARMAGDADEPARVGVFATTLEKAVHPRRVPGARWVAAAARIAETDRSVRSLADLAARTATPARTLQRRFDTHAGVSPSWVLRRYRLLDAADSVRDGGHPRWADVAADLGYSDQAHLVRDFHAATGQTPAAYASWGSACEKLIKT